MTWIDLLLLSSLAITLAGVVILVLAGYERRERRRDQTLARMEREREAALRDRKPGDRINGRYIIVPPDGEGSEP